MAHGLFPPTPRGRNALELELVDGETTGLFAEAKRINDAIDACLHLRSKADKGYALREPRHRHWSRAPKLYLTPDITPRESYRLIILNSFYHLTANDDCARLNLHIEGVHQCRIALRRLRSAFKVYKPLLRRKRIEPIEGAVRSLGTILGAARDLDVLQTELVDPAIKVLGEAEHLAPLLATLAAKEDRSLSASKPDAWLGALPLLIDRPLLARSR
jgi:inorganic triphosphatase YgiF